MTSASRDALAHAIELRSHAWSMGMLMLGFGGVAACLAVWVPGVRIGAVVLILLGFQAIQAYHLLSHISRLEAALYMKRVTLGVPAQGLQQLMAGDIFKVRVGDATVDIRSHTAATLEIVA